ncbi:MAG: TlyA family rRNA (cytidine-2'-O)-methyltransferase [Saprospirales bacterium]|nr:TlyA family rRNA (cytidine-2'-O)-methyltransferase [Saprospirales bacterium]
MRLDSWLTENSFFASRQKAQFAIKAGHVLVNEKAVTKPSAQIQPTDEIRVTGSALRYVSQGGLKLEKAIRHFQLDFSGKRVLDAGASTGGFTDCALQHGAALVYAVDIGTDQLDKTLRENLKVHCHEKTDIRTISLELLDGEAVDIIVADLSFISLTQVLPRFKKLLAPSGFLLTLIKPQFEMEQKLRLKKGIIKDRKLREAAVRRVTETAKAHEFHLQGLVETDVEDVKKKNLEYVALFYHANKKGDIG